MYANDQDEQKTSIIDVLNKIDKEPNEPLNNNTTFNNIDERKHITANYSGFYMMVNFIENNKSDIPEGLRNNCMQNEYGFTLAMYWIRIMRDYIYKMIMGGKINDTVPLWMRHNPEIRDNRGWTIAMHWVMIFKCDVPLWMRHDPCIRNSMGKTIGMFYLAVLSDIQDTSLPQHNNLTPETFLPLWMIHSADIYDEDGYNIIDYWLKFTNLDIPNWMLHENLNKQNKMGETLAMSWIIHRKNIPPDYIKCDNTIKTTYGMTIEDIFRKYISSYCIPDWICGKQEENI